MVVLIAGWLTVSTVPLESAKDVWKGVPVLGGGGVGVMVDPPPPHAENPEINNPMIASKPQRTFIPTRPFRSHVFYPVANKLWALES